MKQKIFISIFSLLIGGGVGGVVAHIQDNRYLGDKAFGDFEIGFSALKYIEKGDQESAKKMLIMALEADLVCVYENGMTKRNAEYESKKRSLVKEFTKQRRLGSHTSYGDGGGSEREIDNAIRYLLSK